MKLLGAGLIWTSLIYAGAICFYKLKERIVLLEKTIMMIDEMRLQLEYLNLPVNELINELCTREQLRELEYIVTCREMLTKGYDFPEAWKKSVTETFLNYMSDERNKLLHLGANLGRSDKSNQINMLNLQLRTFTEYLDRAKSCRLRYGNLSVSLGALAGCMVFIMVI